MNLTVRAALIALSLGLVLGAAGEKWIQSRWAWDKNGRAHKISRELSLDPSQKKKVEEILEAAHGRITKVKEEIKPRLDAIRAESREQIHQVLSDEQRRKFDRLEADWEARRQIRRARRGF